MLPFVGKLHVEKHSENPSPRLAYALIILCRIL